MLIFRWRLAAASASSPHVHAAAIHRAGGSVVRGSRGKEGDTPKTSRLGGGGSVTGRRHDDEAVGERHGGVVDLDGDAAAGAGDPPLRVEVAAELRHQLPRLPHRLAAQVRLRRRRPRPRRRLAAAPAARHGWWLPASSAAPGGVWWGDSGCSASSYSPRAAGAARSRAAAGDEDDEDGRRGREEDDEDGRRESGQAPRARGGRRGRAAR